MKLLIEGVDNIGKSTIIRNITAFLDRTGLPYEVYHCSNTTSWPEYFELLNSDKTIIFDRSHIGEYVYGPHYRGCIAFEDKDYFKIPGDTLGLYVYTNDFGLITDDGLSFENSREAWLWQDEAFRKAFDDSGIPHIAIEGLTPTTNQHAVDIVKQWLNLAE